MARSPFVPVGIEFASSRDVVSTLVEEPTVMWRMTRPNGLRAHLVIGREGRRYWAAWFLNATILGIRDFSELGPAIDFSDRMQFQNWSIGWRLDDAETE
ncbi:MAG: hypothetical protein AB7I50_25255 [Vicinamibacterales bacterium]